MHWLLPLHLSLHSHFGRGFFSERAILETNAAFLGRWPHCANEANLEYLREFWKSLCSVQDEIIFQVWVSYLDVLQWDNWVNYRLLATILFSSYIEIEILHLPRLPLQFGPVWKRREIKRPFPFLRPRKRKGCGDGGICVVGGGNLLFGHNPFSLPFCENSAAHL